MKRFAAVLLFVLAAATAVAGENYILYWGGDDTGCAYPTGDTGNTFALVGAANATDAVNDGQPFDPCYAISVTDTDTTKITCAAESTCTVTFTLADLPYPATSEVAIVSVWYIARQDATSAKNTAGIDVYYRIASTDYIACITNMTGDDSWTINNRTNCGYTDLNPATSQPWTVADVNALELKVEKSTINNTGLEITAIGIGVGLSLVN